MLPRDTDTDIDGGIGSVEEAESEREALFPNSDHEGIEEALSSSEFEVDPVLPIRDHRYKLYTSHFLSTWNARQFEFSAILFIVDIFPGTLLPSSIFGFCTTLAAVFFSSRIGTLVDTHNRLRVMRWTILLQRASVVLACAVLLGMLFLAQPESAVDPTYLFPVVIACGIVERLCAVGNTISIERDWVIVIAEATGSDLASLNARMRQIDLFCALVSPMVTAGITASTSTWISISVILGISIISPIVEYVTIARVYQAIPALHHKPDTQSRSRSAAGTGKTSGVIESYKDYMRHATFLPSVSISLLYFTVLSFGGTMIAYLKSIPSDPSSTSMTQPAYSDPFIASMRGISVLVGLLATLVAPRTIRAIGLERSGLWAIWSQVLCLIPLILTFFVTLPSPWHGILFFTSLSASRLGLWSFDLVQQQIMQDQVSPSDRGTISGCETSLKNVFELGSWAVSIVWFRPVEFGVPATISGGAVLCAALLFTFWARKRRGHTFHLCGEKSGYISAPDERTTRVV